MCIYICVHTAYFLQRESETAVRLQKVFSAVLSILSTSLQRCTTQFSSMSTNRLAQNCLNVLRVFASGFFLLFQLQDVFVENSRWYVLDNSKDICSAGVSTSNNSQVSSRDYQKSLCFVFQSSMFHICHFLPLYHFIYPVFWLLINSYINNNALNLFLVIKV